MKTKVLYLVALVVLLVFASAAVASADAPGKVTGGIHFVVPGSGMEGWMRFDVHATGLGDAATGSVRWQEYNPIDGWRYVAAHPHCVTFNQLDGQPTALFVLHIDSRSGWGEGTAGQYVALWVVDGGTPGLDGDKFTTPYWPPQDTALSCTYVEPTFFFASIVEGNLVIH
ncbi:MAG: hypothetical protein ACYC6L_04630 [Anaerolineae bacterium]